MSQVRTHTRQQNGKTVTVRRHSRSDEEVAATAQRKRDTFERRVLRERQQAANPSAYTKTTTRTAGERSRRNTAKTRSRRHARKAFRLWRRHKVKAAAFAVLALGEITAWAGGRGGTWAWKRSAPARTAIRARLARSSR